MPTSKSIEGVPDPIDVAVGLRLRSLRQEQNLSQEQLGEALGIGFQQVQKYEHGTNHISASRLVRAARVLGVGAAALLPQEDYTAPTKASVLRSLATVRGIEDLLASYARIESPQLRRAVLVLSRVIAAAEESAEV